MKRNYYKVAGHCFCVEAEERIHEKMNDYLPFLVDESWSSSSLFTITVRIGEDPQYVYTKDTFIEEDTLEVTNGHTSDDSDVYIYQWNHQNLFWLLCEDHHRDNTLIMTELSPRMSLDFAITIAYRYNTIKLMTSVIHASTVSYQGKAYLFLGISGTGKSTHSRLWMNHIEGSELINDDKPIIRIFDNGEVRVYGSPWSGKTPCYRNVVYPMGGMVKLHQAPYNKIRKLRTIESYYFILQSVNGKRWDKTISDALHHFEERLVSLVPMWHLDCLPDEEAAIICMNTITEDNKKL
jgi:hypothetical protein